MDDPSRPGGFFQEGSEISDLLCMCGSSWSHLRSLLCSSSPSRQTVRPTNRMVSIAPNARLRLERGSLSPTSSSYDFSSTALRTQIGTKT